MSIKKSVVVVGMIGLAGLASAETGVWIMKDKNSGNVADAANWQDGYVPTNPGDLVTFPNSPGTYVGGNVTVNWPNQSSTLDFVSGLPYYLIAFASNLTLGDAASFDGIWRFSGYGCTVSLDNTSGNCLLKRVDNRYRNTVSVPAGQQAQIGTLAGGSGIRKAGGGTLVVDETSAKSRDAILSEGEIGFSARAEVVPECGVAPGAYLHFDASAADSITVENGQVTMWRDVRDGANPTTLRKAVGNASWGLPRVAVASLNGLDTLTFGANDAATAEQKAALGQPAVLEFPRSTSICECFIVTRDNLPANALSPIGDSSAYDLHRGDSTQGRGDAVVDANYAAAAVRAGDVRVNGVKVDCYDRPGFQNWNLYSYSLGGGAFTARYFARDRDIVGRYGGVSIAEVVFYTNVLSSAERQLTIGNLMSKWLPSRRLNSDGLSNLWAKKSDLSVSVGANRTATVSELQLTDGYLTKTGEGRLSVEAVSPSALSEVRLQGGELSLGRTEVEPAVASGALLHLDADDEDRMTKTEEGGNTFVSAWPDTRTEVTMSAVRRVTTDAMPFLVKGQWNGHNYLDFGPFVAAPGGQSLKDADLGANACLKFPKSNVREGYIVLRDTSNGKDPFFLGGEGNDYQLHRRSGGMLDSSNSSVDARSGVWTLDAKQVEFDLSAIPQDRCVVIGFRLPATVPVLFLGRERNCRQGGLQYGEVILYDRLLSESERRATQRYLMLKWRGTDLPSSASPAVARLAAADGTALSVPAGVTNAVRELVGEGSFAQTGAGRLELGTVAKCTTLTTTDGTLAIRSFSPDLSDAYLHLDASVSETMTGFVRDDDVQCVTEWADVRQNGKVAKAGTDVPSRPTLRTIDVNGVAKPVVHFGQFQGKNTKPSGNNTASWMEFPRTDKVKEVFLAFADVNRADGDCQFLLADSQDWGAYHLHRGFKDGSLFGSDAKTALRDSSKTGITVDREPVLHSHILSSSLHVISVSITNSTDCVTVSSLCCDRRECRWGGAQYGEVLIFTNTLTAARRAEIIDWMNRKWLGTGVPKEPSFSSMDINGRLELGSDFETLCEGSILSFSPKADGTFGQVEFGGAVTLPSAATVRVGCGGRKVQPGDYPILVAPSIAGDLSGWTLELTGTRRLGRLVLIGNQVCLRLSAPGTIIVVQ